MSDPSTVMQLPAIATNIEQAQAVFAARVAAGDGDAFRIKISRRASLASIVGETIAIFDEATAAQCLNPEPWLAAFSGGSPGGYHARVVHMRDVESDKPIAMYQIPAIAGAPRAPDRNVMRLPTWKGPRVCFYAAGDENVAAPPQPKRPDPAVTAPPTGATPAQSGTPDGGIGLLMVFERMNSQSDQRHREEMELLRRSMDESAKRSEATLGALMTKIGTPPPKAEFDPAKLVGVVGAIGAALAPVLAIWQDSKKAERESAARREDLAREAMAKQEERTSTLMEKLATASSEQGKTITVFTDALSQVARSMVQTVAMVGELRQPEQAEPGLLDLVKAGVGAWVEASAARMAPPAPALPPAQPVAAPTAARPAPAPSTEGDAFAEQPSGTQEVSADDMLGMLAQAIGQRHPIDELAPDVVEALAQPEFVAAVRSEGGLMKILAKRLPEAWSQDVQNQTYVRDLGTKIVGLAPGAGIGRDVLAMLFSK